MGIGVEELNVCLVNCFQLKRRISNDMRSPSDSKNFIYSSIEYSTQFNFIYPQKTFPQQIPARFDNNEMVNCISCIVFVFVLHETLPPQLVAVTFSVQCIEETKLSEHSNACKNANLMPLYQKFNNRSLSNYRGL